MAVEGPWNSPDKRAQEPTVEQLRQELSLAQEGLANYARELEAAKHDIERLTAAASAAATENECLRAAIEDHQLAVCDNPKAAGTVADERLWGSVATGR